MWFSPCFVVEALDIRTGAGAQRPLSAKSNITMILVTEADILSPSDDVTELCLPLEDDGTLRRIPKLRDNRHNDIRDASPRSKDINILDSFSGSGSSNERNPDTNNRSGDINMRWPINVDILNSSLPPNIDRSRLSTDPNVFIQPNNSGASTECEYNEYRTTKNVIVASKFKALRNKISNFPDESLPPAINGPSSSRLQTVPGNVDRLVATLRGDEEYEELFNETPDEVRTNAIRWCYKTR